MDLKQALTVNPKSRELALKVEQVEEEIHDDTIEKDIKAKSEEGGANAFSVIKVILDVIQEKKDERNQALEDLSEILDDGNEYKQ